MKTFNVWVYVKDQVSATGPWQYACAVLANNREDALNTAKSRFGLSGQYQVYEGL